MLCGNEHSGEVGGYRFVKPSSNSLWSVFAPIDGESGGDDWRRRLEDRDRTNRLKVLVPVWHKPVVDRDKEYRSEFATLRQPRRESLKARGLTDAEINWAISHHLLWDKGAGFAIAALSLDGQIQGCQIARDDRSPKYIWDSKDGSGQLPDSGEMPIAYFMHPACDTTKPIKLIACDAFLKSLVAGIKHWRTRDYQTVFIGAPGCNFQPIQLQSLLETLKPVSITYAPDAGDVVNAGMMRAIATFAERCTAAGYEPDVLWWGQFTKAGNDLDDLTSIEAESAKRLTFTDIKKLASTIEKRDRLIAKRREKFLELLPTVSNDYQLTAAPGRVIEWYEGFTPTFNVESSRTILIRGWLAAGKTEAIIQSLRGLHNRQIVWLAPRNGLLRGTAERIAKAIGLPCYHYQDDAGLYRQMLLAGEPGIYLMAPDSLKSYSTGHDAGKVFDWSRAIVIADEFSGIRKEILGKSQSLPEFERAMREAGTFIAADAFLSNADCKIIGRYREGDRRILAQMPRKSPKKIQCVQTRTKNGLISMTHQGISIALMDQWISEGIRSIAIATDNLLEGKIAQKYLELRGIRTLLICSETPEENHEYLPHPDECLRVREIEANIITPTLQSGGDIQTHFDRGIVLVTGILQPTQILQLMGRFRQCHNWTVSAPMYTQEAAITFSSLDSKKIEQWGQKLGEGFDDLGITRAIETFSWSVWAEVTSEVEKAFSSEYLHHLLKEYFASVETVEVDLTGYRLTWNELLTITKNEDAQKAISANLGYGQAMLNDKKQPRLNSEVWDLKLAVLHDKYPRAIQKLLEQENTEQPDAISQEIRIYSSKRLDGLKWNLIATEPDETSDADLLQNMQQQFTCSSSRRFTAYRNIKLFRDLDLKALVRCKKKAGKVSANVDHFCAESPKVIALWEQFRSSPQLRKLFATVDDIKGFWEIINRCLSFLGYQKASGGNARIKTQELHRNGSYISGRQRLTNSKSSHHTGWLLMECSGSKLFQEMFETIMDDLRDLIQREAKERDKWRSPYPPDIPKAA